MGVGWDRGVLRKENASCVGRSFPSDCCGVGLLLGTFVQEDGVCWHGFEVPGLNEIVERLRSLTLLSSVGVNSRAYDETIFLKDSFFRFTCAVEIDCCQCRDNQDRKAGY